MYIFFSTEYVSCCLGLLFHIFIAFFIYLFIYFCFINILKIKNTNNTMWISMPQSLTKTYNQTIISLLKNWTQYYLEYTLLMSTAAWQMCTVWFVLQGDMQVIYKTLVMFCCIAVLIFCAWFTLPLILLGTCLYKSYTIRVLHDFILTKRTLWDNNLSLRGNKEFPIRFPISPAWA